MRLLKLVVALLVAMLSPMVWPPAWAASPSTFAISSPTANAGNPEVFTITRTSGGGGIYVLFQTNDGTAVAGTDYTFTKQLLYFKGGQTTATVSVPTVVDGKALTLQFKGAIAASNQVPAVVATATIKEPTQTCPDGSVLPIGLTCPTPAPPPPPPPSIGSPIGPVMVTAICSENSLWDTPLWDAYVAAHPGTEALPKITAGNQYSVMYEPGGQQGGLVPNNFTGAFVTASGPDIPDTHHGGYEFDQKCFPPAPAN